MVGLDTESLRRKNKEKLRLLLFFFIRLLLTYIESLKLIIMKFFNTLLVLSCLSFYVHFMIILCTDGEPKHEVALGFIGSMVVGLFSWQMIERLDRKKRRA